LWVVSASYRAAEEKHHQLQQRGRRQYGQGYLQRPDTLDRTFDISSVVAVRNEQAMEEAPQPTRMFRAMLMAVVVPVVVLASVIGISVSWPGAVAVNVVVGIFQAVFVSV
jgi:hypothetical protein